MTDLNHRIAELYADSDYALVPLKPGRYIIEVQSNRGWHMTRVQDTSGHPASAIVVPGVNEYFDETNAKVRRVADAWRGD